jgi:hypothetical protein
MMSPYVCVKDIVEHIYKESEKAFKNTKYESNCIFYHDALLLMTAKETISWMKKMDYWKRWLLPFNNFNTEADLCAFKGQPIGNSPEMMPWDCSLTLM